MLVCGIDLNTKSVAFGFITQTGCCTSELIELGEHAEDRFDGLILQVDRAISDLKPDIIYIEKIPFVRNAKAELDLSSVLGGIRTICAQNEIPYILIQNLAWKKGVGLRGKVTKDMIRDLMIETYGIIPEDWPLSENAFDALAIATYGALQHNASRNSLDSSGRDVYLLKHIPFTGAIQTQQGTKKKSTKGSIRTK